MATRPVHPGLVEEHGDGPRLAGGHCPSCDRPHFPLGEQCPWCGAPDPRARPLGPGATVWAATVVTTAPPGYDGPVPYGFGVAELDEGLRVVTRFTGAAGAPAFGTRVALVLDVVATDDDGTDVVTWAFAPVEEAG